MFQHSKFCYCLLRSFFFLILYDIIIKILRVVQYSNLEFDLCGLLQLPRSIIFTTQDYDHQFSKLFFFFFNFNEPCSSTGVLYIVGFLQLRQKGLTYQEMQIQCPNIFFVEITREISPDKLPLCCSTNISSSCICH